MIQAAAEEGVAIVAPEGSYAQAEFCEAIRRALALCPEGRARCLIMDFSRARGVESHSVVRIRETTRELASLAPRFAARCAVVVPSDPVARVMEIGGVISTAQGIHFLLFRDAAEARAWALEPE